MQGGVDTGSAVILGASTPVLGVRQEGAQVSSAGKERKLVSPQTQVTLGPGRNCAFSASPGWDGLSLVPPPRPPQEEGLRSGFKSRDITLLAR